MEVKVKGGDGVGLKPTPLCENNIKYSPMVGRGPVQIKLGIEKEFSSLILCESRNLCGFIATLILWMTVLVLYFTGEILQRKTGLPPPPPPLVTATGARKVNE